MYIHAYVCTCTRAHVAYTHTHTFSDPWSRLRSQLGMFPAHISLSLMPHWTTFSRSAFLAGQRFQSRPLIWESIALKWSRSLQSLICPLELVSRPALNGRASKRGEITAVFPSGPPSKSTCSCVFLKPSTGRV